MRRKDAHRFFEESLALTHPNTAIVTGAFSYTGRYVARRLLDEGVTVTNNDSAPSVPSPDKREVATFVMRLLGFAVTLAVIGTFFLPWLRLDGAAEARSGVALPTIAATPMVEYLFAVAPAQAGVLVGCPVVMFVFAVRVALAYAGLRWLLPSSS